MTLEHLELVDTPAPSTYDLRLVAVAELRAHLEAHPGKWARLTDGQVAELGGLWFGLRAEEFGFDTHIDDGDHRYARLTPAPPPRRRRPWARRSDR